MEAFLTLTWFSYCEKFLLSITIFKIAAANIIAKKLDNKDQDASGKLYDIFIFKTRIQWKKKLSTK